MLMSRLPALALLVAPLAFAACARAGSGGSGDTAVAESAMASGDSATVKQVDSTAVPVVITFKRDSLGLAPQAAMAQVTASIEAMLPRLRAVADFEVLAISPALLAANVRPKPPMTPNQFVAALRTHPLVSSVELSAIQRTP